MKEYKCRDCGKINYTSGGLKPTCTACQSVNMKFIRNVDEKGKTLKKDK